MSTVVRPFGDAEVAALLHQCRKNNARLGLTGMLLLKGDQFMQVFEGDDDEVDALYSVIREDPRHTDLRLILTTPITARQFAQWSMGYEELSDESIRGIPGYNDFFDRTRGLRTEWVDPSKAKWLLDWFRSRAA